MSHLEISLLGPMQVVLDDESVTEFRADTAQALLAYLAMHAGTPCPRTSLAGLLWSDYEESSALTNLRQALRRLRTAIGDRDASLPFLLTTRATIALNPESDYWLDVDAFSEALDAVRSHAHRSLERCAACAKRLAEAVELYRGEFLAGFSLDSALFEGWMVVEREHLHGQALEALGQLAAYHEAQGAYEQAVRYARQQLALEPWREEAHRALMRALALSGQRSAALAQYEACRDVLREELGVKPAEETTQLYERIRDHPETGFLTETRFLHNLPAQLTPFVGRESELAHIAQRLGDPDCRLLTLVGPGGSGKTRLALEAAARQLGSHEHGVFFVSLAPLQSVETIVPTIAQAIGFSFSEGAAPKEQLLGYLRRKNVLLILDNYEHLLEGAGLATEILRAAPEVRILATSRAGLSVSGEHLYPVAGMDVPQEGATEELHAFDAVQLFLSSARRARPDLEPAEDDLTHVAEICRSVEGMPLAILLAASWSRMLTLAEIEHELAAEIERSMDFLEADLRDAPARHRSMRAVFDHSWRLLSEREQDVFAGLSVFRGGLTRAAAQEVATASLRDLMSLVDRSLLHRTAGGQFEMHELLRQYATEKLDRSPGSAEAVRGRHCAFYAAALARWAADLKGPQQQAALAEMEGAIENARAAWVWAVERGEAEQLDQAMEGLGLFYDWRGRWEEGEAAFRAAADRLAEIEEGRVRVKALTWEGLFDHYLGRPEIARELMQLGLSLLENPEFAGQEVRPEKARLLLDLGWVEFYSGNGERARQVLKQSLSLYRALGDRWMTASALSTLGQVTHNLGAYDEGRLLQQEALAIRRTLGDQRGMAESLAWVATAFGNQGRLQEAERLATESVAISRDLGDRIYYAKRLWRLGMILGAKGEFAESLSVQEEGLALLDDSRPSRYLLFAHMGVGSTNTHLGQYKEAWAHLEQAVVLARESGYRWDIAYTLFLLANLTLAEEQYADTQRYLRESVAIFQESEWRSDSGKPLTVLARVAHGLGQLSQARRYLCEALEIAAEIHDWPTSMFALPVAGLLLADRGEVERAVEIYALSLRYGFVANSRWFEDVYGQHIAAGAAALPPEVVASVQGRGRARDLWTTVEEVLDELRATSQDEEGLSQG